MRTVTVKKAERFNEILAAIREEDAARAAKVLEAVTIPAEPDPLALRGPSWTAGAQGAPPAPGVPGTVVLTVRVHYNDGSALPGASVEVHETTAGTSHGATTTSSVGTADFTVPGGLSETVTVTTTGVQVVQDANVRDRDLSILFTLDLAPPPPPPPHRPPPRPPPERAPSEPLPSGGGEIPPRLPAPVPEGTVVPLTVGSRVLVFGYLPGVVTATPTAPGDPALVRLDTGIVLAVHAQDLTFL